MVRIVVADDHPFIREGVAKIVRSAGDMHIVGMAGTIADTIELVVQLVPDAIILDISLPGCSGLDGLEKVHRQFPDIPILVLSMHPEERFAIQALKAGAAGYITKDTAVEELIKAVRKITAGGSHVSQRLGELLASNVRAATDAPSHEFLTVRERQVLSLLAAGSQIKQIAGELSVSVSSINAYRSRILRKMGLRSNADLIRYAVEHGMVA